MRQTLQMFLLVALSISVFAAYGQSATTIKGKVLDETGLGLVGASVILEGTTEGTTVDLDGNFKFSTSKTGSATVVISFVGYLSVKKEVSLSGGEVNIGTVSLEPESVGLAEVEVIASIAVDRKTPVAVSSIKAETIIEKVGNQELPEILRSTPSVYATKEGGGFGDGSIRVRGFGQVNFAVMINGIPVNDMENGRVFWSNWAGLSDVASQIQVQRGLGASKLAVPSVGGSMNIITNAADVKKKSLLGYSIGNDGYQKYSLMTSTGLSDKGWAATFQLTHTRGDGYVDGTKFRAFSYFASVTKKINDKHMISATYLGAPQWHHQRSFDGRFDFASLRTFVDPDNTGETFTNLGIRYNHQWGYLNGEEFTWRRNFYHKPKGFLNHYWAINDKTELSTSAYVSLGRGGGTGARGRLSTTAGTLFNTATALRDPQTGIVRFDDIYAFNSGATVTGWGNQSPDANGQFTATSRGNGLIRRASVNSHDWYGILSTLTHEVNDNWNVVGGFDFRYYKGIHYRRLENLLGNAAYQSRSNDNNPDNYISDASPANFGNFTDDSYQNYGNPGANVLNYYNDGLVKWFGLFGQVEYTKDDLTAFVSLAGSQQSFKRVDYFNYLDSDPEQETDWEAFLGGTLKIGANYNINSNHNVFFNAGFISRQPFFDNVFINFRNDVNPDVENQNIISFELGYGYRSEMVDVNVNLYNTDWGNRQFDITQQNAIGQDINYLFDGVNQIHRGIEIESKIRPAKGLTLNAMVSFGDWKYRDNFTARGTNLDTNLPEGELTIFADGLEVGDAAQTTASLGFDYKVVKNLTIDGTWFFNDRLFADYDVNDSQFLAEGGEVVELPSYSLFDFGLSYKMKFNDSNLSFRANVYNAFDTEYVAQLYTNIKDDPTTARNEFYDNQGFFGFGRTWNVSLRYEF